MVGAGGGGGACVGVGVAARWGASGGETERQDSVNTSDLTHLLDVELLMLEGMTKNLCNEQV